MAMTQPGVPPMAILQQAARWYAELHADGVTDTLRRQWQEWLMQSPAHREAWQYVERVHARFAPVADEGGVAAQALSAVRSRQRSRRRVLGALAGLGVTGAAGWLGLAQWPAGRDWMASRGADIFTATGQILALVLPDGSAAWLDTATAIDTDFTGGTRGVRLRAGALLVETMPGGRLPFDLRSGRTRLVAADRARFQLRRDDGRERLIVHAGTVVLQGYGEPRAIGAGACHWLDREVGPALPVPAGSDAWIDGVLHAEDMRLDAFLAELGRYRTGRLDCTPAVAGLRVLGTYSLHDTDDALAMLARALPLRIERRFPGWTRLVAHA